MDQGHIRRGAVAVLGPTVRRVRREIQWRRSPERLAARRGAPQDHIHLVADHATPLFRVLPGVDPQLQVNKVTNLAIAAARLDGLVVAPGERFSFWWHVGRPSARRGFVDGLVLDHGHLTQAVGGGMCQLTNLLYWMTLHTPLIVVERWRHSYDVFPDAGRTQPFGSGATCAWPVLDLQVVNRTQASFRLDVHLTQDRLVGAWTSSQAVGETYEVYEAHHVMTNEAPGVFLRHNVLRRRVLGTDGCVTRDELVAANQALMMYQPFLGPGAAGV